MSRTFTKADIVETLYDNLNLVRNDAKQIVEDMLSLMKQAISDDSVLLLSGFGKFEAYGKAPRKGRNPQTAETITLPPRRVVVFRLSHKFKAELNGETAVYGCAMRPD